MNPSFLKKLEFTLYFLFCPERFIDIATKDSIQKSLERNKQLREKYPDGKLPKTRVLEYRKTLANSTMLLRHSVFHAFFQVLAILITAAMVALVLSHFHTSFNIVLIIRLIGLFLIVWAIFSRVGWEIQTFSGDTLPEIINKFWFRLLYLMGAFLLFLGFFYNWFKQ